MKQNNYTTFYIVRHGQTMWNKEGKLQGHADSPLTQEGIDQANEVAKKLKHIKFDLAFSSDLFRAKRTAEIIAAEHNLLVKTTHLLRERSLGKYEGMHKDSLRIFDEVVKKLSHQERFENNIDGELESDKEIVTRMTLFLRETAITHQNTTILVASHSGIMRAFLIYIGYGTYDELHHTAIGNTAYIKLTTDGVDFFVKETEGIIKQQ